MSVHVISVPSNKSQHAPKIQKPQPVKLTEGDEIGFLVSSIEASDKDNDTLWYDIVGKLTLCALFLF